MMSKKELAQYGKLVTNIKNKNMNIDRNKHVWEGWTVGDFIQEIEPIFDMKMRVIQHPWFSKSALKKWVKDQQPYYKKHIPEVYKYFLNKTNLK